MFQFRKLFRLSRSDDEAPPPAPPVDDSSALLETALLETAPTDEQPAGAKIGQLKQVLSGFRAYVATFGQPGSELERRAVMGAILAALATDENSRIEGQIESQLERLIDEAIAALESLGPDDSPVDVTTQLLAEQAAVWLQAQEATAGNVISAYLQQFAPDGTVWTESEIAGLALTVIATLNDGSLSRSGGRQLLNRVIAAFSLEQALSRWVAPEWVAHAQRVASYVSKGDLQTEVRSIAWAYIQQFESILSPQLIEQIMQSGSVDVSPAELLSGDLDDFSRMLYYKFQLLEADPVVTKSHAEIAADIHRAIADWQTRQDPAVDAGDRVQNDLKVSSTWLRTDGESEILADSTDS